MLFFRESAAGVAARRVVTVLVIGAILFDHFGYSWWLWLHLCVGQSEHHLWHGQSEHISSDNCGILQPDVRLRITWWSSFLM
jgi:hypothetical protein